MVSLHSRRRNCIGLMGGLAVALFVPGAQPGPAPGAPAEVEIAPATQPAGGVNGAGADGPEISIHLELRPAEGAASPLFVAARRELVFQKTQPSSLKLPPHLGRDRECWLAQLGTRELLVLRDHYRPLRLAVDADGDGNLTEEHWCAARRPGIGEHWDAPRYGPVKCIFPQREVPLRIEEDDLGRLWVLPAEYREGALTLDGKQYRVALVDTDFDGRYDRAMNPEDRPLGGAPTDWMAIDRNLDGKFDLVSSGRWEIQPLTPLWAVGEQLYQATVAPDGAEVRLKPVAIGRGLFNVGANDAELLVAGLSGVFVLKGGNGQWSLPAGRYSWWSLKREYHEADTQYTWTLLSAGRASGLKDFEIEPGQTCARPIDGPLVVTPPGKTESEGEENGRIEPGSVVADQSGHRYRVMARNGRSVDDLPEIAMARAAQEEAVRRYNQQYMRVYQQPPIRPRVFQIRYRRG